MKNLKDNLTNICAIIIVIIAALQLSKSQGVIFPHWVDNTCIVLGALCLGIGSYLQGKNPDGSTKSKAQVDIQNQQ
jgi:hypothetical protein